jgi:hypothetical protein
MTIRFMIGFSDIKTFLAGTIQLERVSTVWRACGDETKTSS